MRSISPAFLASVLVLSTCSSVTGQTQRDAAAVAQQIDTAIQKRLDEGKHPIATAADDAEFVRRAYLDLHGVIPTADEVRAFLNYKEADKRAKLIDELLSRPGYGQHFARNWHNRIVPKTIVARRAVRPTFLAWMARHFNENHSWDRIVSGILLAEGDSEANPAASFYLVNLSDGPNPQPDPARLTAAVSRLFLGIRLECCQCHDHQFTNLKQTEFWGLAAFFTNVRVENLDRAFAGAKQGAAPVLREGVAVSGPKKNPKLQPQPIRETAAIEIPESRGKVVQARFLGGPEFVATGRPQFRPALAAWVVAPENPTFAQAAVNRMWATFFGKGLVEPVDDMQPENRPTHPEILELLTKEFIASSFDLKHLIRCLANTKAYQRTSTPPGDSENQPQFYGHMPARVMTADQLFDSLSRVLNRPVGERIANAGQKFKYGDARERFRTFFHGGGADDNVPVPEYGHGVPQVLRIMNSPDMTDVSRAMQKLAPARATTEQVIENMYLSTLSRRPTRDEISAVTSLLAAEPDRNRGYADLMWVLLNSGEFLHNH